MTVSNQVPSASSIANGATTVFPFTFYVAQDSDLVVRLSGVTKVLNVDYSVVGAGTDAGGTVVMAVAPASGVRVDILRNTPLERDEDFQTSGDLPAGELNRQLDRVWQALQDINILVGGSSGASMTTIFHNPFFDIYGAADPAVGPPVGMTTPGSAVEETTIVYPDNPTAQSVKVVTSGTSIGNGCTITPTIQPWGQGSVSVTIPIYTMSSTRSWVVHGYDGTTYTLLGQTPLGAPNTWNLIKGSFTPAPGSNWSIIVSFWDGSSYYGGFQGYIGGINVVKGVTPANTLEDSLGRRSYIVITAAAPTRAPDFTGERWWDSAGGKFYMANGQSAVGNWIALT